MSLAGIRFFSENTDYTQKNKTNTVSWIKKVIQAEGKKTGTVNFIFCDDDTLHQLNVSYLKHDTLTDILTFDFSEGFSVSGDIYISTDRVKENAKLFSQDFNQEIHRVIIHGILHLCGYHDESKKEKAAMTDKENFYLEWRKAQ
jgi:probable rRNA maturation factor